MDSEALLARENEFKKLNMQLERKSENLLKQIENAVHKKDIFSEFLNNSTITDRQLNKHSSSKHTLINKVGQLKHNNDKNTDKKSANDIYKNGGTEEKCTYTEDWSDRKCDCNNTKSNDIEFLYAFVSVNVKNNVLPPSFLKDKVTVESVCKFLSAKVNLMQEQIDKVQSTIDKKAKQCDAHMSQLAEYESERMTLLNRASNMMSETADMKAKCAVMQNRLNEKDRLYKEQRSVADRLTTDLKQFRSRSANLEARCGTQEEIISTLKQQLETAKITEKEFRDSSRNLSASHQSTISRLDIKLKALTTTIDKQTSLIDNLRKQNALLLTEGALKAFEKGYCDFLNQDL